MSYLSKRRIRIVNGGVLGWGEVRGEGGVGDGVLGFVGKNRVEKLLSFVVVFYFLK